MPKTVIPANAFSVPVPSRRALMVGGASLAASAFMPTSAQTSPDRHGDALLANLENQFEAARATHKNAHENGAT